MKKLHSCKELTFKKAGRYNPYKMCPEVKALETQGQVYSNEGDLMQARNNMNFSVIFKNFKCS